MKTVAVIAAAWLLSSFPAWAWSEVGGYVPPYNLVLIILDTSKSFQIPSRQPGVEGKVLAQEALRLVQDLVRQGAVQKRRRTEGQDRYVLIAADAASQVIWSGTQSQLLELTPEVLATKLAVRRQFAGCTDIKAALNEAARVMRQHPKAAEVYVLTFSDLLHEPPREGWSDCLPPSGEPPEGIEWDTLGRAHLGFYFVSKDFRYRPDAKWRAALERQGLTADFLDAAQALTERPALTPPPPARYQPTPAEVEAARERVKKTTRTLMRLGGYTAGVLGLGFVSLIAWITFAQRWRRQERRMR